MCFVVYFHPLHSRVNENHPYNDPINIFDYKSVLEILICVLQRESLSTHPDSELCSLEHSAAAARLPERCHHHLWQQLPQRPGIHSGREQQPAKTSVLRLPIN